MLRDVFYYGDKPNAHPREQFAESLEDARKKSTTEHFWIINEFCDYRNFDWDFDFEFLPDEDVWAEAHNNVWPSQHQKDSGTWLCPKEFSDLIIYRGDVDPVIRKNIKSTNWVELDLIDPIKFDFSWHPDPSDPPYIYKWGCKFYPPQFKHVLEYRVPGATQTKYMDAIAELLPNTDLWVEYQEVDHTRFDFSWRPDPMDPPFIYVWGNKYIDGKLKPTLEYHAPGATDKKYMTEHVPVLPEWDRWVEVQDVDKSKFDFSWRPDPREPAYIYTWGNKWIAGELRPTLEYHCEGATDRKYMSNDVEVLPEKNRWKIVKNIVTDSFDFSWRPDPREPDLTYVFGNELYDAVKMPTIIYTMPEGYETKYVDDYKAKLASDPSKYTHLEDSFLDDYSWQPDPDSPPYIYAWGNQWNKPEDKVSVQYVVEGATEYRYMEPRATRRPCMDNWVVPDNIDPNGFDFSWEPNPADPPYIYEFATNWNNRGGPRYVVPGATDFKYIEDVTANTKPVMDNWLLPDNVDTSSFDFSWVPHPDAPPYIYEFATNWNNRGGPRYVVPGATDFKYIEDIKAKTLPSKLNWEIPSNVDVTSFDFSWVPHPDAPPYIYEFATIWNDRGGPKYIVPGATEYKYIEDIKAKTLPSMANWEIPTNIDISSFDFSWVPHPDAPPYIYEFATNWNTRGGPRYVVPGATDFKYVEDIKAKTKVDMSNWVIPENTDTTNFDFSWVPHPDAPPYIYEFGTQWAKTGGPRYVVKDAIDTKYVDELKATALPSKINWTTPSNIDDAKFDYSWHPDATSPPYIYVFGTQWASSGGPVYTVPGATKIKYIEEQIATALPDMTNWVYDETEIDITDFDFSWHPFADDEPYIYEFGTQWAKTGGPKYIVEGAKATKYVDTLKVKALPNPKKFITMSGMKVESFDYSWHPDATDEPYIYVFGNQWHKAEIESTIEYRMPGAIEKKYVSDIIATLAPSMDNWEIPDSIDTEGFDFSWRPDPYSPPYIYEFGTQWAKTGGPRYVVEGATTTKYVDTMKAKALPNPKKFITMSGMKIKSFDYSWHPDATDEPFIYVFGNQWHKAEIESTIEYRMPGAIEKKYVSALIAEVEPDMDFWEVPKNVDASEFDFSWRPDPYSPPYIYEFGTQWAKTGGPKYIVEGATTTKYVDTLKVRSLPDKKNFITMSGFDIKSFDYSWHPDATDEPYIYVFGNQWHKAEIESTIEYRMPGAIEKKYVSEIVATLAPSMDNWVIPANVDVTNFDFSWRPDPYSPPYIYEFGTQWAKTGGPKYVVSGASTTKYESCQTAIALPNKQNFVTMSGFEIDEFDYSWHPDATDEPFIYVFGNQWFPGEKEPTIEYRMPMAIQKKYVDSIVAKIAPNMSNWEIPNNINVSVFDFSWHPDPTSPAYIYQFGTLTNTTDGPRYITPGNNGEVVYLERVEVTQPEVNEYYIETTLDDLVNEHPNEVFWAMRKSINYDDFDFNWRPMSLKELDYVQVFGSPDSELTQTYFVNSSNYLAGKTQLKFIDNVELTETTLSELFVKPDMFFVDKGNPESTLRFEALKAKFGTKIQKTRYLNSWVDTINRCTNRATTELVWVLNSELDYSNFDFNYYPNPWQMKMVHVFGTQWSHWGTTFMVNRETFREDTKYIKIVEHLSNLNFVKHIRAKATNNLYDVAMIDFGNVYTSPDVWLTVPYKNSYIETIREIVNKRIERKEDYIWICSSVCDYGKFDFSYICDPFARDQLHVFPSGKQKFGDTFLLDVNKAREVLAEIDRLEDYTKINYNQSMVVSRLPEPVIVTEDDTHVSAALKVSGFPYATIIVSDNIDLEDETVVEPMPLWSPESKSIMVTSTGATKIVVPAEVKDYVKRELYDYPYIKRMPKLTKSKPLDIVFLSNGETGADENYEHLLKVTEGLPNRVVRVDGINGRAAAYHAAAEASNTPWMFTVFAKLKVNPKFDWNWQPDRMQVPKHYIFHAKNPVNGLTYGHQAMIAYNKKLTLANEGRGLDFTLDDEHETVPLISGTAIYNTDPFSTWRTAFREVLKLKADYSEESRVRLDAWLSKAEGDFSEFSIKGATDASDYYDDVDGEFDALKLSYEWAWLRDRFETGK